MSPGENDSGNLVKMIAEILEKCTEDVPDKMTGSSRNLELQLEFHRNMNPRT